MVLNLLRVDEINPENMPLLRVEINPENMPLLRVEINPENMLDRSFYQFKNYSAIPLIESKPIIKLLAIL